MTWLLDTNVVSEGVRQRPDARVMRWISTRPRQELSICLITLAELRSGALAAPDAELKADITQWIENDVISFFDERIIALSVDILIDWIGLSQRLRSAGTAKDAADLLIAATARFHNLTLVTRNVRDFAGTGTVVYDPWRDRTHRMDKP